MGDSINLTGLPHGVYNVYVYFYDICNNSAGKPVDYQGWCNMLMGTMTVALDGCDDSIIYGCTDPEAITTLKTVIMLTFQMQVSQMMGAVQYDPPPPQVDVNVAMEHILNFAVLQILCVDVRSKCK